MFFELIYDNFDVLNPKIAMVLFNQVNFFYIAPHALFTCLDFPLI